MSRQLLRVTQSVEHTVLSRKLSSGMTDMFIKTQVLFPNIKERVFQSHVHAARNKISCVSPSSVVALAVAGSPHCHLPVTRSPEAGESADVAFRGSWICFSGISEGSLHKGTEKEDGMQTQTHTFEIRDEYWQVNYFHKGQKNITWDCTPSFCCSKTHPRLSNTLQTTDTCWMNWSQFSLSGRYCSI